MGGYWGCKGGSKVSAGERRRRCGVHSTALHKKETCSENPDCRWSSGTSLLLFELKGQQHSSSPSLLLLVPQLPITPPPLSPSVFPNTSKASREGGVSSCVLVFVCVLVCVNVVQWFSQACNAAATDMAAPPLHEETQQVYLCCCYQHAHFHFLSRGRCLQVAL